MKTNNWNWQKINVPGEKKLNLPEFNKSVLIIEKRKDKFYGVVGHLKSIDINGPHWSTETDLFGQIFGSMFTTKRVENLDEFNPSYWCEILLPQEEPETK